MSEMIDGYTAQKIKEFWAQQNQKNNDDHSMCKAMIQFLQKEIQSEREVGEQFAKDAMALADRVTKLERMLIEERKGK